MTEFFIRKHGGQKDSFTLRKKDYQEPIWCVLFTHILILDSIYWISPTKIEKSVLITLTPTPQFILFCSRFNIYILPYNCIINYIL